MSRSQDYLQDPRTLPADTMRAYRHEGARGALAAARLRLARETGFREGWMQLLSRTYARFIPPIPAGIN